MVLAQSPVFKNYNTSNGLPSSETYCTLQDDKGYMWFGTDRGLVKFDGYTFHTFTTADGLADNTIFNLYQDKKKRIWYQSFSAKTGYVADDTIQEFKFNPLIKKIFPSQLLINMTVDDQERIWMSTQTKTNSSLLVNFSLKGQVDSTLETAVPETKDIYIANNGFCMAAHTLLARKHRFFDLESRKLICSYTSPRNTYQLFGFRAANGDIWITTDHELLHIKNGSCRSVYTFKEKILSITVDEYNNVYLGTLQHGALLLKASDHYQSDTRLLASYSVSGMSCDGEGGVWFCTLESGIFYMVPNSPVSLDKKDGLNPERVEKITCVDEDIVLMLAHKNILVLKPDGKKQILRTPSSSIGTDLYYEAPDRIYYCASSSFHLPWKKKYFYLGDAKSIRHSPKHLWLNYIYDIVQFDRQGKVTGTIDFSKTARITACYEMGNGELLVGSLTGLYIYKKGRKPQLVSRHPLLSSRISQIESYHTKYLLVGTIGQGLLLLDKKDFSIVKHINTRQGLPSMMCQCIYLQGDSVIWVGTNNGLCRIKNLLYPQASSFHSMSISDGLVSNEIHCIAPVKDKLWIGTPRGVSILEPGKLFENPNKSLLYIDRVLVNGKVSQPGLSIFKHNENNISIFFTGLNYRYAGKLRYKYRLQGASEQWNYTNNRSVIYNTLSPGQYSFECKAIDPHGRESRMMARYNFSIEPPFWQRWWFISVSGLILVFSLLYLFNLRLRIIQQRIRLENDLNLFRERALRAQMNPHFIYNTLSSIQNYILKQETSSSVSFLSKFSRLMRLTFNNTNQQRVLLRDDLDALRLYCDLENLRFSNKFELHMEVSPGIDLVTTYIPPLVIQPFVENAILHGLLNKKTAGNIWVKIEPYENKMRISIQDDGVGRLFAEEIEEKKRRFKPEKNDSRNGSSGMQTTIARIEQAWYPQTGKTAFKIVDLQEGTPVSAGTLIQFYLPLSYD